MVAFFKRDIMVNRSSDKLLSELSASTIISCDRMNYSKKGKFRGNIWHNGFSVALNTFYWNSFESQAVGYVEPFGDNKCTVHLSIGPHPLALIIMCAWNPGLMVALIALSISLFSDGISKGITSMLLLLPFIATDVLFLRFALYSNYKKLKSRMLDILV